jgi:uncharacterized protein (DUF1697 family)
MKRIVALLRGINVGGKGKLPMTTVRAVFEDEGATDVVTYIQSGNIVFSHPARSPAGLGRKLEHALGRRAGFPVPVMLRTAAEMAAVVAKNPYPRAQPKQLHILFLAERPGAAAIRALDLARYRPEECVVAGRDVYMYLPDGIGRAKLPPALGKLKTPGTARNWQTVNKLVELSRA